MIYTIRRIIISVATIVSTFVILHGQLNAQPTPRTEWQKVYGGNFDDEAYCAQQTTDGGYIVVGYSSSYNVGNFDYWIVKLDKFGEVVWQKSYGGSGLDVATSVQQTVDGGYIVAGSSQSLDGDIAGSRAPHGGFDYWVMKLDNTGNIIWKNCYGGTGNDLAICVQQTSDLGYVISGSTNSTNGDITKNQGLSDYWIVKLAGDGSMQWQKTFGGSGQEYGYMIRPCPDGGYIMAGTSYSMDGDIAGHHGTNDPDYWIVKLNSSGDLLWERSLGGTLDDEGCDVQCTPDGGYVVAGFSQSTDEDALGNPGNETWVVKLDNNGLIQWTQFVGNWGSSLGSSFFGPTDFRICIVPTFDGGYAVTGGELGAASGIVKLDAHGNFLWQARIAQDRRGLLRIDYDTQIRSIQETVDSGFIIAGLCRGPSFSNPLLQFHGEYDLWVVKLGFFPEISSTQNIAIPHLICESDFTDTVWLYNTGAKNLVIDSTAFTSLGQYYSIHFISDFPLNVQPGDSTPAVIRCAAPPAGQFTTTLNIFSNDTLNSPWPIVISGVRDSIGVSFGSLENDTFEFGYVLCSETKDSVITLFNASTIPTTCTFSLDTISMRSGSKFSSSNNNFLQPHIDQQIILLFLGATNPGSYKDSLEIVDSCGRSHVVYLRATVDSAKFAVSLIRDTTICPGDSILRTVIITNHSHLTRTLQQSGSNTFFRTSPSTVPVNAGDTAAVQIYFTGSPSNGTYSLTDTLHDDCDGMHLIPVTIHVDGAAVVADIISDTTICPADSVTRRVLVRNISGVSQTIHFLGSGSALFSVALDSLILNAGDSALVDIFFQGSPVNGIFSISYDLPAGCGNAQPLRATVRVDNGAVIASAIRDTMICPGDSIRWNVALHNVSGGAEQVQFTNSGSQFIISPNSLTLAAGDSAIVNMLFTGSQTSSAYRAFYALPGCGSVNAITANVLVHAPDIRVPYSLDTIICPFTPLVFTFPVTNADSITHTLSLDAGAGTLSKQNITLRAGQTDTLQLSLPGSPIGNDQNSIVVIDDCGAYHYITFTLDVRSAPPAILSLQTDTTSMSVGTEHNVYLLAKPYTAFEAGGITLTLTNEPTALQFDSLVSQCGATITRGENTNTITFAACSSISSDTIATLYYNTLVGSTLTPTVTLQNVQTANTCDTVSGAGFATINILPPGCELGTVIVHPYTSAINSIYPNPATGIATITYSTVQLAELNLNIYDVLGRTVRSLVNAAMQPGMYVTSFDATPLSEGIYYVRMQTGTISITRPMIIGSMQ